MGEITNRLENVLKDTSFDQLDQYSEENWNDLLTDEKSFTIFMKQMKKQKNFRWRDVFLAINMDEHYGSDIINMVKRPKNRDLIIKICIAAHFSFDETQQALKRYGLMPLYARDLRDVVLIVALRDRIYDFEKINEKLADQGCPLLELY